MTRPPATGQLVQSLFDRLIDRDPRTRREVPSNAWEQMYEMRQAVARDLTNLLNTRRSEEDIPEEYEAANHSVPAYGVQDFTSSPMDREQIRRAIEKSVRTFETRLSHVNVTIVETAAMRLDFRIVAVLHLSEQSEPVVFDATLPSHSRRFNVTEAR